MAGEGDKVTRGATLALLSSRELAELVAEFLVASTEEDLAAATHRREETLYSDRITSRADLEAARAALAAARAARDGIKNKLHAVGISDSELKSLANANDSMLATYRIRAPISGIVARRTATLGATVSAGDPGPDPMFTIVDDSVLWADIAVYKQDIGFVHTGDPVKLLTVDGKVVGEGEIATVLPLIDESSRTVTARMIVDNSDRQLRPGQFVSAEIETRAAAEQLLVPSRAIVQVEGRPAVFVPSAMASSRDP